MCEPTTLAIGMGVMTAVSAASQVAGGFAESSAAKARSKQYEKQRLENRTATSQSARDRFSEFSARESQNRAAMAISGLSLDSFGALTEANRQTALEDITRINDQGAIEDETLRFASREARAEGRQARIGGILSGAMTLGQGALGIASNLPASGPMPTPRTSFSGNAGTGGPRRGGRRGSSLIRLG